MSCDASWCGGEELSRTWICTVHQQGAFALDGGGSGVKTYVMFKRGMGLFCGSVPKCGVLIFQWGFGSWAELSSE